MPLIWDLIWGELCHPHRHCGTVGTEPNSIRDLCEQQVLTLLYINPLPTLYYLHSTVYCLHSIAWCKFFDLWKFFEMASYYLSPYWYSTAWCKMVLVLPISLYHCCLTTAAATLNSTELLYYTWWILNCYTTDLWCFWWTVAFEFNSFCCLWCQRNLWQNSEHMPLPMMHLAFKLILS